METKIEKQLDMIAQKAECVHCGMDIECPACKIKMMDEHLWIPLSELKDLLEMYSIKKKRGKTKRYSINPKLYEMKKSRDKKVSPQQSADGLQPVANCGDGFLLSNLENPYLLTK